MYIYIYVVWQTIFRRGLDYENIDPNLFAFCKQVGEEMRVRELIADLPNIPIVIYIYIYIYIYIHLIYPYKVLCISRQFLLSWAFLWSALLFLLCVICFFPFLVTAGLVQGQSWRDLYFAHELVILDLIQCNCVFIWDWFFHSILFL
jgi:hypothetical protein